MRRQAFTLVELLVVIAIIGLIASLSVIALGNARQKSRDSKRVADVKQVQTALELFFSDQGRYPTALEWSTGSLYATSTLTGTTTYMERIPTAQTGGVCNNNYTYAPNSTGDNYTLNFCLEAGTGSLSKGVNFAKAASLGTTDPSLILRYTFDEGTGTVINDVSGNNHPATWYGTGSHFVDAFGSKAGSFESGRTDYLKSSSTFALSSPNNALTFSFWVYYSGNNGIPSFYSQGTQGATKYIWIAAYGGTVHDTLYTQYWDGVSAVFTQKGFTSYFANYKNQWVHVTMSYDCTNKTIKAYRNGQLFGTIVDSVGIAFPNTVRSHFLGAFINGSDLFLGYMDDFRIYDRILSVDEILAIYNSTK